MMSPTPGTKGLSVTAGLWLAVLIVGVILFIATLQPA